MMPYTSETFIESREKTVEFLTAVENMSFNHVKGWRELSNSKQISLAIEKLREVEVDLERTQWLKKAGSLN